MNETNNSEISTQVENIEIVQNVEHTNSRTVYVNGRTEDDVNSPYQKARCKRKKKNKNGERMDLSDGDKEFYSSSESDLDQNMPPKRTFVSSSSFSGDHGNLTSSQVVNNDINGNMGDIGANNLPLIIMRVVGNGSFGNPNKTLKWFDDSFRCISPSDITIL